MQNWGREENTPGDAGGDRSRLDSGGATQRRQIRHRQGSGGPAEAEGVPRSGHQGRNEIHGIGRRRGGTGQGHGGNPRIEIAAADFREARHLSVAVQKGGGGCPGSAAAGEGDAGVGRVARAGIGDGVIHHGKIGCGNHGSASATGKRRCGLGGIAASRISDRDRNDPAIGDRGGTGCSRATSPGKTDQGSAGVTGASVPDRHIAHPHHRAGGGRNDRPGQIDQRGGGVTGACIGDDKSVDLTRGIERGSRRGSGPVAIRGNQIDRRRLRIPLPGVINRNRADTPSRRRNGGVCRGLTILPKIDRPPGDDAEIGDLDAAGGRNRFRRGRNLG